MTAPSTPLSGTYHEIRVHVEIEAGETSIVSTWLESRSPSQPSDELDIEEFLPPMEPPPYAVVPEAELFCKFDSTHWIHGETVEFWLHATVWHNGQTTSVEPKLITTRQVYNGAVLIQHKALALSSSGSGVGTGFQAWNHKVVKNVFNNAWSANTVTAELPPATSHFILAHGTPGVIWAPAAPTAVNDAVVQGAVPGGLFPLYFAFLASCRVAENDNDAVPNAYLSEAGSTTNRCVVAFKITMENVEMLQMFYGIADRVADGCTVLKAAEDEWSAGGTTSLASKYGGFAANVLLFGDSLARPRWLYDGSNAVHTTWKDNQ
ncbi:MAG: hypothetical protein IT207_04830 [Fimbriimonadaceae bacterium]|nr:hypothetical protein [Fimbriimonadaceae bacterium]